MRYLEATAQELAELDRLRMVCVVPIAAVEQHGPHLPVGTDTILCTAVAEAVERCVPLRVLLIPTIWLGASAHHLPLGATLDTTLDHFIATLGDVARSLLDDGFQRVLFLNGHGGNIDPMRVALRSIQPRFRRALLVAGNYWSVADEQREQIMQGEAKFVGHACEFETSMMLHVRPDLVDPTKLTDAGELVPDTLDGMYLCRDMQQRTRGGFTGRPDLASKDKGQALFEAIVDQMVDTVDKLLAQPLGCLYQDFVG